MRGGGLRALADMSAKNVSFFDGFPNLLTKMILFLMRLRNDIVSWSSCLQAICRKKNIKYLIKFFFKVLYYNTFFY